MLLMETFLLRKDLKVAVQVHRKDTADEHSEHLKQWKQVIINDGVLVSPFISQREREVRDMARELDGDLIILKENGFAEFFKPVGWEFEIARPVISYYLPPGPTTQEKAPSPAANVYNSTTWHETSASAPQKRPA